MEAGQSEFRTSNDGGRRCEAQREDVIVNGCRLSASTQFVIITSANGCFIRYITRDPLCVNIAKTKERFIPRVFCLFFAASGVKRDNANGHKFRTDSYLKTNETF